MAEINFDIDVNEILGTVLRNHEGRNDLASIIQNGTDIDLEVTWQVIHGNVENFEGSTSLEHVDESFDEVKPAFYAVGVDSANVGSQIFLYITSGSDLTWGFLATARPSWENRTRGAFFGWRKEQQDVLNYLNSNESSTDHMANNGPWTLSGGGVNATTTISATSPAECRIQFIKP